MRETERAELAGKQPAGQTTSAPEVEASSQGEDLLSEALRLRGDGSVTPAPKAASKPASKQPARADVGNVETPAQKPAEGDDLLAEALRLRGQQPASEAQTTGVSLPAAAESKTTEGTDIAELFSLLQWRHPLLLFNGHVQKNFQTQPDMQHHTVKSGQEGFL